MARPRLRRPGLPRRCRPGLDALESRQLLAVVYQSYPLPDQGASPSSMVVGPDHQIWFANTDGTAPGFQAGLGEIDPATGLIATFPFPTPIHSIESLVSGPGGDLSFVFNDNSGHFIGIFDPSRDLFSSVSPPAGASFGALAVGADGNLYFTDSGNSAIGKVDALSRAVTEYPAPQTIGLGSIVAGPGGDLWFGARQTSGMIGSFDPTTHAFAEYPIPSSGRSIGSIASGTDGNVYFVELDQTGQGTPVATDYIARINTATHVITEYSTSIGFSSDYSGSRLLTAGPDGNIWYTYNHMIGEFNPTTGADTTYLPHGQYLFQTESIVNGPDNNLWVGSTGSSSGSSTNYITKVGIVPASLGAIQSNVDLDPSAPGTFAGGTLGGRTVFLDLKGDGTLDPGDPTATTDPFGYYAFNGLAPGTYTVRVAAYAGDTTTHPAGGAGTSATVTAGAVAGPSTIGMVPTSSLLPLNYDPTPFGTHNPDDQTAEVNGLYRLILGRAPDATGGPSAVAALKNGEPLSQLAADLLSSTEYDTDVVAAYYRNYLRRAPDATGGAAAVAFLRRGGTADQLAEGLLDSAEYGALFSANPTFVQALYGDLLGRLASSSEIAAGAALLGTGYSRSQYVASLIGSAESDIRGVGGLYSLILTRADVVGQSSAVTALQGGETLEGLASSLFGSAEFIERANATVG